MLQKQTHMKYFIYTILFIIPTLTLAQKIVINFETAPTATPSVSKAALKYNKDFAYSLTFDDGTVDAFTHVLPVLKGGFIQGQGNFNPLYYTDGCGNNQVFRAGVAWNSVNFNNIDVHTGEVKNLLTWKQLDTLYDNNWDVMNHSFSHRSRFFFPMTQADYQNEIVKNIEMVKAKTRKAIDMTMFVAPNGDDGYLNTALQLGQKATFDQSAATIGYSGIQVDADLPSGLKLHRQLMEESLLSLNFLDKNANRSVNGTHFWYNEFTHGIDQISGQFTFYSFVSHMNRIMNTYGKGGSDRVWMAPLQEVFEYLTFKQTAKFAVKHNGKALEVTFDLTQIPTWLRRKTLTLVVNTPQTFSKVDVPAGVTTTFNGTSTVKIINLDFTAFTATPTQEVTPSVFKVFPNPSFDNVTIELKDVVTLDTELSVVDITGRIVIKEKMAGKIQQLNTSGLSKGIYFIQLKQGNQAYAHKFVKQ